MFNELWKLSAVKYRKLFKNVAMGLAEMLAFSLRARLCCCNKPEGICSGGFCKLISDTFCCSHRVHSMNIYFQTLFTNLPSPQPAWYSIPGSNCINTNTLKNIPKWFSQVWMLYTWSEGRRLKSAGGFVITYLLLEDSALEALSRNLVQIVKY